MAGSGSAQSVSRLSWGAKVKRPNFSNGGLHSSCAEDCLYELDPRSTSTACVAVALGDALDPSAPGPKKVVMKLHVNRGHAFAHQSNRVLVVADGDT